MYKVILFIVAISGLFLACDKFDQLLPEAEIREISDRQVELIRSFSTLTEEDLSACELIFDPLEIPDVLCRILIDAEPGSEIVFLVDKTSSMSDDIDEVKRNINKIIDCLPEGVRLGAATYGDFFADGSRWFDFINLTENRQEIRTYVNAISVIGGGDEPESVYDGIFEVLDKMSWKDCGAPDRIIVMGDAPPLTGSRSNHTLEEVLAKAESICPNTEFYPVIILDI